MTDDLNNKVSLRQPWYLNANRRFVVFNVVFALAFFNAIKGLMLTSYASEYDSYIPFIPFISAYFFYLDKHKIFSLRGSSFVPGLGAVGVGVLLLFLGRNQAGSLEYRDYQALVIFAAVVIWIGGFAFCYGRGAVRAAIFPLLFLFFMVPIPGAALEQIILFLQKGSAEVSYRFFQLTGIPVARDGFVFHLTGLNVEVAKECSGIRSSLSLFITGILAAYLFLRTGWARAVLLLTIVPIAVIKNGIRIFTLSALGAYWDKRILDSDLHRKGGFVFFLIALVLVGAIIVMLRRAEGRFALKNQGNQ